MTFDFYESIKNSMEILDFQLTEKALVDNEHFIMAWEIARKEAVDKLEMSKIIFTMKRKYDISDFDFELLIQGFDEDKVL